MKTFLVQALIGLVMFAGIVAWTYDPTPFHNYDCPNETSPKKSNDQPKKLCKEAPK